MSDIEEIKTRLDIVDVIGQYVTGVKKAGRSYKANCPFHNEKTPSFTITPDLQRYKCFGCGETGDVITFIQKIERVDFPKALEIAAAKAGYELKHQYSEKDQELKKLKERILEANELAAKYWNYILQTHPSGKVGRDYAAKRHIRKEEIDKFMIGYATKGYTNLVDFLHKKGFSSKELLDWGLATERKGKVIDKFRDRLILSIFDTTGRIVGFSGRLVTPNDLAPKYLNSPETLVYRKSEILMGIYQARDSARQQNFIILEEGNIDLLSSHRVGIENIVAVGGTALTEQQTKLLKRFADQVYFAFDSDAAGRKALLKGLELAERLGLKHKAVELDDYQDPDEMISQQPERWTEAVASPVNTIEFLLRLYQRDLDLGTADGKSAFLERMLPVFRMVRDEVQVKHYSEQVAVICGLTTQQVEARIANAAVTKPQSPSEEAPTTTPTSILHVESDRKEIFLLALLISGKTKYDISSELFSDVNCQEIYNHIKGKLDQEIDFGALSTQISDGAKEVLQDVLFSDTGTIEDINLEIQTTVKYLEIRNLKQRILELRRGLQQNPEDENLLAELQNLTKQLRT